METVSMAKDQPPEDKSLIEAIEKAESNPADASAQSALGDIYYDRGQFEQAIVQYQKAMEISRGEWVYESNLADAYRAVRNWDEAIKHYDHILESDPKNDKVCNKLGVAYYSKGEYQRAIEFYTRAIQVKPEPVYYVNLADAYRQSGNLQEAEDYYQNAVVMDETYSPAHNGLGIVYALNNKPEQAIECFKQTIALEQNEPIYFVNLGDAYRAVSQWENAIEAYNNALKLDPDDADTLNATGVAYSQLKDYDKAIEYYQRAMSISETALYNANLGNAYRYLGNLDKATAYYQRALELDPKDDISHNALGIVYYRKGKYAQAIQQYQKAVEIKSAPIYFINIADSYRELSKLDKAIENYKIGISTAKDTGLDASNFQKDLGLVYNDAGILEYSRGDQEKALGHYHRALEFLGNDDAVYYNIYLSLKTLKRYPEAETNLRKAIELNPRSPDYQAKLEELKPLSLPSSSA